jgi:uncharacterized membrane protein YphA (DoxX/SURF4 family)
MKKYLLAGLLATLSLFLFAHTVSAHEVYVLDQQEISAAVHAPTPDFSGMLREHGGEFAEWSVGGAAVLLVIFFIGRNKKLRTICQPAFARMKRWAPHVTQATIGLSLIAGGYFHSIFGVEFPLAKAFGSFGPAMAPVLLVMGVMLLIGILPRIAALGLIGIFVVLTAKFGFYMIQYWTYLGEAIAILIFGPAHSLFSSSRFSSLFSRTLPAAAHGYKFAILRVFFGISLIYASIYAKFLHGDLALSVVNKYQLTHFFLFDPLFLVFGAMLIEVFMGLCFAIGFQIRFVSIFFLVFLTMSLVFFGESVWPHFILIGTALSMFLHGYDRYTAGVASVAEKGLEPVF